jgi:hypothetical protein
VLDSKSLKHLFIEIHFALLEARGLPKAGEDIQKMLLRQGFASHFTDFSHMHAEKSV